MRTELVTSAAACEKLKHYAAHGTKYVQLYTLTVSYLTALHGCNFGSKGNFLFL